MTVRRCCVVKRLLLTAYRVKEQKTINPWENLVPVYVVERTMQVRNKKHKQLVADPSMWIEVQQGKI